MSGITGNFGRRGKGKTSLAYWLASGKREGVAVFDPTRAFAIGIICSDRTSFEYALDLDKSPVVFAVDDAAIREDAVESDFRDFVSALKLRANIAVVIDESSYLQSPNWMAPALDDEIRCGRRRKHDLYLTQHRMADCNGLLLSLITDFNFFQTKHPRDLERIAEYCSPHVAGIVSELKDLEFLHYEVETGLFYVHEEPSFWRVSLAPEEAPATGEGEAHAQDVR